MANLGDRYVPVTLTINGVGKREEDQDMGPPVLLPNDVTPASPRT